MRASQGWVSIRGGVAQGRLIGGCLETICRHLKGSRAWLDLRGALLLLETSEEVPSPDRVAGYLAQLGEVGVVDQIAGLLVARPYGYAEEQIRRLWTLIADWTSASGVPALANIDCGHADPMLTLPLGIDARLDATAKTFETLEPAVTVA
jgi:muramoyltetrapeptide carboxypeptidase LdcA involved in peptidoglycan recycling